MFIMISLLIMIFDMYQDILVMHHNLKPPSYILFGLFYLPSPTVVSSIYTFMLVPLLNRSNFLLYLSKVY